MILGLIQNVTLLVTLALGLQMLARHLEGRRVSYQVAAGLLFGGVCVAGMMTPIRFAPGVIYDGRSIVLALAGLFGGPLAAGLAAVIAGIYRWTLGGAGVVAGVGTVIEASLLGVTLYYLRRRDERWVSLPALWAFGVLVHLGMLALQWLIPGIDHWEMMRRVGVPVLVFFPTAFVLMAFAFLEGERLRRRDEELRESAERLVLALDGADLGAWDWDIVAGRIGYNVRAAAMLGYTLDEIDQRIEWWDSQIHPDDCQAVRTAVDDHLAGRTERYEVQLRLRHKDGNWVHVLDRGRVISRSADGRPLRACGTHLDITRAKELEEQLRQAQKMESVGQLAGGIAHDFNNMLSVIIGHAELALSRVDKTDPQHTDLAQIRQAATRSAELTGQLLAFARRQTVAPRLLDLNQSITDMLGMMRRLIGEDIDLLWRPAEQPCLTEIDPSQLDQILTNLMVNARDAIVDVGKITIETATTTIDAQYCASHAGVVPGSYVTLVVSDDGAGMDRGTLARIFDPFFTTKPVGQGTGLGLATVYGIVKQNQGFINVYSEPGEGTTFRIYLPKRIADDSSLTTEPSHATSAPRTATILLVEDEPTLLRLAERQLTSLGHRVLAAGSPSAAVALAAEQRDGIDLLLTDVVMPEMSGRALWHQLSSLRPELKCLFMSGYTANVIAHRGILDAGIHFLQKPFTVQELAVKLHEALAD